MSDNPIEQLLAELRTSASALGEIAVALERLPDSYYDQGQKFATGHGLADSASSAASFKIEDQRRRAAGRVNQALAAYEDMITDTKRWLDRATESIHHRY